MRIHLNKQKKQLDCRGSKVHVNYHIKTYRCYKKNYILFSLIFMESIDITFIENGLGINF